MKKICGIGLILMLMVAGAEAAGPAGSLDVRATAQEALSMDFDTTRIDFGFVNPANSPYEIKRALSITLKANQNWVLSAVANDDLRSGAGVIPIKQLMWRRVGTDYQGFSRTSASILAQGSPTPNEGSKLIYDMLLIINWPDHPGTYSTSLTFTLSSKP